MTVGYYPGCSLHGSGREYDDSLRAVAGTLQVHLQEVPEWLCCGASSAHALDRALALALAGDTLTRARKAGLHEVLAPCAMCYSRLATTVHELEQDPDLARRLRESLGASPEGVRALSVLGWLDSLPDDALQGPVKKPLAGLKVACYYGCLLVRPGKVTGVKDREKPQSMERVLRLLGAEPVPWAMATECCGGSFSLSDCKTVLRQGRTLVDHARRAGANLVAVACPMCHSNLDLRQGEFSPGQDGLPILYLTQVMGLAYGLPPKDLGLDRHFVSVEPVLEVLAAPAGEG